MEVKELVSGRRFTQLLVENILYGNAVNLNQAERKHSLSIFIGGWSEGAKAKDPRFKEMLYQDEYLNALRCVLAHAHYHKAQGGEWNDVFVDIRVT